MIVEVADFKVKPEEQQTFCAALQRGVQNVLSKAKGYRGYCVLSCKETAGRVLLLVDWECVEDHTVGFRESTAFAEWRAIIAPFFLEPPHVEHFDQTACEREAGQGS